MATISTERLDQALCAEDDDSVVAALQSLPVERDRHGDVVVLGLRNAEGVVYRRFQVHGERMAIRVGNLLREFGYVAEPGPGGPQNRGCRTVFRRVSRPG